MEAKWKVNWDYLGWKTYDSATAMEQKDWNQTLVTRINQIATQMYQVTLRSPANRVYVHPKTFLILKDFEYLHKHEGRIIIGSRYDVIIDEKITPDKVIVKYVDETVEKIKEKTGKSNVVCCIKHESKGEYGESTLKFIELDPENKDEFTEDGFKILREELLTGEITILNHRTIDPVTGEILIDYHNEIPQDIWMGTRPNEPELSDLVMVREVKSDDLKALLEERIEALKKSSNPLITPEPYEKQLANLNDIKITVKKPLYKRIFEFFKPTEQVKIKNVKNSKININIK